MTETNCEMIFSNEEKTDNPGRKLVRDKGKK
jgi:hypothetical protein